MKKLLIIVSMLMLSSCGKQVLTGPQGPPGTSGSDGQSCTVITVTAGPVAPNGGSMLTCPDGSTSLVLNGTNTVSTNNTTGTNGGTVTFNLVQVIQPCSAASSPYKETLLGLQGGQLLAAFSDDSSGDNTRLAFIPNGSFIDTDSSGCNFTVTGDGSTYSNIRWNAGSNSYTTWLAGGYNWTLSTGWVAQ